MTLSQLQYRIYLNMRRKKYTLRVHPVHQIWRDERARNVLKHHALLVIKVIFAGVRTVVLLECLLVHLCRDVLLLYKHGHLTYRDLGFQVPAFLDDVIHHVADDE